MPDPQGQREKILNSIRRSLGTSATAVDIELEYKSIPRTYRRSGTLDQTALVELFKERLREYDAGVYSCLPNRIADTVAEILTSRGKLNLIVPSALPPSWLPVGFSFNEMIHADVPQLDVTDGILTGCTVAIAETGSIVLQNGPAQGPRIVSLVPDYHLCIVFSNQVVEQVPQAFERLGNSTSLPTTFISGPSATADIEMTRIKGVHGPRFLDVLIVDQE
jgi:L-lactate dehydrogenase complex protein LldG